MTTTTTIHHLGPRVSIDMSPPHTPTKTTLLHRSATITVTGPHKPRSPRSTASRPASMFVTSTAHDLRPQTPPSFSRKRSGSSPHKADSAIEDPFVTDSGTASSSEEPREAVPEVRTEKATIMPARHASVSFATLAVGTPVEASTSQISLQQSSTPSQTPRQPSPTRTRPASPSNPSTPPSLMRRLSRRLSYTPSQRASPIDSPTRKAQTTPFPNSRPETPTHPPPPSPQTHPIGLLDMTSPSQLHSLHRRSTHSTLHHPPTFPTLQPRPRSMSAPRAAAGARRPSRFPDPFDSTDYPLAEEEEHETPELPTQTSDKVLNTTPSIPQIPTTTTLSTRPQTLAPPFSPPRQSPAQTHQQPRVTHQQPQNNKDTPSLTTTLSAPGTGIGALLSALFRRRPKTNNKTDGSKAKATSAA